MKIEDFRPGDIITHNAPEIRRVYGLRFEVTGVSPTILSVNTLDGKERSLIFAQLKMCEVIKRKVIDTFDVDGVE